MEKKKMPTPVQLGGAAGMGDEESNLNPDCIARARQTMRDAETWRRLNPRLYELIEDKLLDAARHGRKMSVREVVERIRWFDFTDLEGNPTAIDNNISTALARMLVHEHPEARPAIILRRSILDGLER